MPNYALSEWKPSVLMTAKIEKENDLMVETTEFPTGSTDGESTSGNPQGQADDYKARFAGQQKAYNQLKAQYDALVAKVEGKDAAIAEAIEAKRQLEATIKSLTTEAETVKATVLAEKAEIETKYNLLSAEQQKLAAKMEADKKKDEVRKVITSSKPTLAEWFDDGVLKPVDESGAYLEGDALQAYLDSFESKVLNVNAGAVANKVQGAKPPAVGVGDRSNSPEAMSHSDLHTWLTKNPTHADYDKYEKVYFRIVNEMSKPKS
jgi:hypothetical protein